MKEKEPVEEFLLGCLELLAIWKHIVRVLAMKLLREGFEKFKQNFDHVVAVIDESKDLYT